MKRLTLAALTVLALCVAAQTAAVHAQTTTAAAKTAKGTVKSTSGSSLVIVSGGKDMTFTMDTTTKVVGKGLGTKAKAKGGTIPASESLAAGDSVSVTYQDMGGAMHASTVRITAKAAAAKMK